MEIEVQQKVKMAVRYLKVRAGVRYWEDGTVNGVEDADGSRIPCRDDKPNDSLGGGNWCPIIDMKTGKIENWPQGTTADIHYKVCDDGEYELLDPDGSSLRKIDGYVIGMMCPEGEGYGDYIIMKIAEDGTIENWKVDLSEFEKSDGDD